MLLVILLLVCIGNFVTDIYLPALPSIAEYFDVPRSTVQNTISVYLFSTAFAPLIFGPVSDLIGRKKLYYLELF